MIIDYGADYVANKIQKQSIQVYIEVAVRLIAKRNQCQYVAVAYYGTNSSRLDVVILRREEVLSLFFADSATMSSFKAEYIGELFLENIFRFGSYRTCNLQAFLINKDDFAGVDIAMVR